jgi:lysophospholipase L1-like esterase
VFNLSVSGARAADVVREQVAQLLSLPAAPDLVTLAAGANDLVRRSPAKRLVGALQTIMAALPVGSVVATMPQGLGRKRALDVNAFIRDEAHHRGLRVADVRAHTGPPWDGKFAADGFHPNDRGYDDWVDAFAEVVTDL